jgi:poly-gamma-glutamate synthesis protein (capsule biosynthesis protein)
MQDIEHYKGKPIIYSLGNFVFNGFKDADNNTGWLLRLDVDRQGVRGWQTVVAHIDRNGTPHPANKTEGMCWGRGAEQASACLPPQPGPSTARRLSGR